MARPRNVYLVHEEKSIQKEFVLDFLEEHYFTREVLLTRFMEMHTELITPEVREIILADLRRRYEPIVTNRIIYLKGVDCEPHPARQVAVGLGVLEKREHASLSAEWEQMPINSAMLAYWIQFVQKVAERRVNFFQLFTDVNIVMKIEVIVVDEAHGNKRIGTNILREMVERARKRGIDFVYGVFTSARLRRVAARSGFQSYCEMSLNEFVDSHGSIIYPGPDQPMVSVMGIKLN